MTERTGIDPTIFAKDHELEFSLALTEAAEGFSKAQETIEKYERQQAEILGEIRSTDVYKNIVNVFGDTLAEGISSFKVEAIQTGGSTESSQTISEEEYQKLNLLT